ncbi:tetratricopeptide repeat protein [Desulfuromonas acetexigens]|uniref:Tetratricopeptide repeat protein n=1 Tax=Trichloromonas acetexigens TaxID=38815 RepID=A0A550J8G9_9BACT|nr:tetratricopeptide repeat protein [Desulfuromonas acetexigens]
MWFSSHREVCVLKPLLILFLAGALAISAGCGSSEKKPPKGESHYIMGLSHFRQQQLTQALKEFLLAVEANPQNADYQNGLALAYQFKKAYPEAEKHYIKALALGGDSPEHQNNLAALYLDMQRWDDAIKYFRLAASNLLFGQPERAHTGIGFAYMQKGEYLDAVGAFQQAIKENPNFALAHFRLGEVYHALDKWELAVASLRKAAELAPVVPEIRYKLGLAHMKNGQTPEALAAFEEVLRLAPTSEEAHLAKSYIEVLK